MEEIKYLKLMLGVLIIAVFPALICGCQMPDKDYGIQITEGEAMGSNENTGNIVQPDIMAEDVPNPDVPDLVVEGELQGLYYEKGGSMQAHSDFMIEVNPEEIVKAKFWPSDGSASEITVIGHVPISEESWQDIIKITDDLRQFMMVNSDRRYGDTDKEDSSSGVLDGRPYTYLDLTLNARGMEETIPYIPPQDRRFLSLENILMELVDPIGREIVWYDEPELVGIYFSNDPKGYSYQCTNNTDEGYKFYAYSNFLVNHFTSPVSEEVWERVNALCDSVGIMDFVSDRDYKIGGTLYMSDGRQKTYELDKKTAETLRSGFEKIEEEIKAGELR